jgi:regulator of protease activity HflC (stomatin/prohibitin superfamily)
MFGQLIDFILRFITGAVPFTIIPPWAAAIVVRFGHVVKQRGPGIQFHMPWFTVVLHTPVTTQAIRPPKQTVTTKDGFTVVAGLVLRFQISDVRKFTVDLFEAKDAMEDVPCGVLRAVIKEHTWAELQDIDLDNELSIRIRSQLKRWGIHLEQAALADFGRIRSLRLLLDLPDGRLNPY